MPKVQMPAAKLLFLALLPLLSAQDTSKPVKPPATEEYSSKTFDLKYADPEHIRQMFAERSFVMDVNRNLKALTAHGPAAFLKEVEDAVKRYDVPSPPPANIQLTLYLLTVAAQAPAAPAAMPADLTAVAKEMTAAGSQPLRVADSQVMRLREGQPGETSGQPNPNPTALFTRIRLFSASVTPGPKGDLVSLNGLRIWLDLPSPTGEKVPTAKSDPDIWADMDVEQNQSIVVSKAGTDKPVVVVLRAAIVR